MAINKHMKPAESPSFTLSSTLCTQLAFGTAACMGKKMRSSTGPRKRSARRKSLKKCQRKLLISSRCSDPIQDDKSWVYGTKGSSTMVSIQELTTLEWMHHDSSESWATVAAWRHCDEARWTAKDSPTQFQIGLNPPWNEPPTRCPLRAIHEHFHGAREIWTTPADLQIPESWAVFKDVNWKYNGHHLGVTPKCSDGQIRKAGTVTPPPTSDTISDPEIEESNSSRASSQSDCTSLLASCWNKYLIHPRARGQWNTFAAMADPTRFAWKGLALHRAPLLDGTQHLGYVDLNQHAQNHDIWPQNTFNTLISHFEARDTRELLLTGHELPLLRRLGRWIVNAVETEMFPSRCEQLPQWPESLISSQPTIVEYTCRATPQTMGWQDNMCPLLFAVHFSPPVDYYRTDEGSAVAKLASTFRPMMTLFILYYLDTRASTDDPMPTWMVLFGITYNELGIIIQRHSPWFRPSIGAHRHRHSGWCASSIKMGQYENRHVMLDPPHSRGHLLSTLNAIQGHCKYVMERLKAWEGYERACQLLMA